MDSRSILLNGAPRQEGIGLYVAFMYVPRKLQYDRSPKYVVKAAASSSDPRRAIGFHAVLIASLTP